MSRIESGVPAGSGVAWARAVLEQAMAKNSAQAVYFIIVSPVQTAPTNLEK
jgi:hypothetical protein